MHRPGWLLAAALGLSACGGGPVIGSLRVEAPLGEVVRAHKALLVTTAPQKAEWTAEGKVLVAALVPKLATLGYFSAVTDEAGAATTATDLELKIVLTEVVKVDARERTGRGDAAGEVKAIAEVRLVDKANHAELGRAVVTAAGYAGAHGGTTEDALDEVAAQIVELVRRR